MADLKDPSSQLVEQPWMKWTTEEKEKAFQEYRERAGIIPHKQHVAKAIASASTPATGTHDQVAYVPKPTQTPVSAKNTNDDSGDTHMDDGTMEEKKGP